METKGESLGKKLDDVKKKTSKPEQKKKTPSKVPAKLAPIQIFRTQLNNYEKLIVKVIDKECGLDIDRFMVVVENAVRAVPKLLSEEVDRSSLFGAILTAAQFGLEPNTPAGLSFIIPRKGKATFQIGYHGFTNLMYRHPRVKKVTAEIRFKNDLYARYMDDSMNWRFKFTPNDDSDRGERVGVFAIVHLEGIEPSLSYMSKEAVEKIKIKSLTPQNYEESNDPEGWMWKKAAIKQVAKLIPKGNATLNNAINIDSMLDAGATITISENGQPIITKTEKEKGLDDKKLKLVFGDSDIQDADVIDEKP